MRIPITIDEGDAKTGWVLGGGVLYCRKANDEHNGS